MNQQIESDLHDAFAHLVSGIPADAGERVRGIDYHPRTGRLSPRLTAGAMVGAAATTTAVVSVVVLGGSQAAFAGWSASPAPASAASTSTADASCQAQLAAAQTLPGATAVRNWSEVATDVRGPFTLVIYQDGTADATCLTGPSTTAISQSDGSEGSISMSQKNSATGSQGGNRSGTATSGSWAIGTSSGDLDKVTIAHLASTSQGPYTLVDGQVAAGVTGVTIVRSDGEHVQTTTGNGWFVAWWPGTEGATSAVITTASGETTQALNTPLPLPGGGACGAPGQTTSSAVVCTGDTGAGTTGPSSAS
jgi:hypothetical protein